MKKNKPYPLPLKALSLGIFIILLIMSGFFLKEKWAYHQLSSTDLSGLSVSGISLKQPADSVDWSQYKKSQTQEDMTKKELRYQCFEGFYAASDSGGMIVKLQRSNYNDKTLQDIEREIGAHFIVKNFDDEQGLSSRIYYDKTNRIKATYVYPKRDELQRVVWTILELY